MLMCFQVARKCVTVRPAGGHSLSRLHNLSGLHVSAGAPRFRSLEEKATWSALFRIAGGRAACAVCIRVLRRSIWERGG